MSNNDELQSEKRSAWRKRIYFSLSTLEKLREDADGNKRSEANQIALIVEDFYKRMAERKING